MSNEFLLEPVQERLLATLAEAARNVPESQREPFMHVRVHGPYMIQHLGLPGGSISASAGDIEVLIRSGLLLSTGNSRHTTLFLVSPRGFQIYEAIRARSQNPLGNIESSIREYLNAERFQKSYPNAFAKWQQAEQMLWGGDTLQKLTTIGHLCREAVQEFATELATANGVDVSRIEVAKTANRISAIVSARPDLSKSQANLIDALGSYWKAVNDLIQRQEHGGQKEGESLIWEDGRRVVFQTAIMLFEVDRSLSQRR